jgi:hypothetical protein
LLLISIERRWHRKQGFLERRQVVLHRSPDNLAVYTLIVVAQNVADAGNVLPTNILVGELKLAAEMPPPSPEQSLEPLDVGRQRWISQPKIKSLDSHM